MFSTINLLLVRSCFINTTHFMLFFSSHFYAWNKNSFKINWVVFLEMMIKVSEFLYTRSMLYFVFNEETVKYTKIYNCFYRLRFGNKIMDYHKTSCRFRLQICKLIIYQNIFLRYIIKTRTYCTSSVPNSLGHHL